MLQRNKHSLLFAGSFIDVRDFASPRQLAEHLHYLDKNNTAFNEYIEKLHQVRCKKNRNTDPSTYACRLCTHLHDNYERTETVPDITEFWSIKDRCQEPKDFYEDIAPSVFRTLDTGNEQNI